MHKNTNKAKPKSFLKKHWSNILFFGFILLFIIPGTRVYIQSWIVVPLMGAPEMIEANNTQENIDYNIHFKDLAGNIVDFKQSEGQPVLINFWATWCTPCIAEMPGLVDLYKEFGTEVDFYFVSNESTDKLQLFLSKKNYNIPVYNSVSKIPESFDTSSIPATYLINSNGVIVAKAKGMANWDGAEVKKRITRMLDF